ncbi:glycosyltransferase [Candidatus Daviesbacteria bacterium]|nr:glycosyltransferase [Candidatus Daviesbacteria bacterium]
MKNTLVSVVIVTRDRKKDLIDCVNSYLKSSYQPLEIIVVDNASKPPLVTWFPKRYKGIKLITSEFNIGAAAGRNLGLAQAQGEYILFSDDDAYADKNMVKKLVSVFEKNNKAGIVQPLVYDRANKDMLQGAGHDINLTTGRIWASGVKVKDTGQYRGLREVPMCGCVWMVKREVFAKIGNYDEDYFIPYEDSDFSIRAAKAGFKLYCYSEAKTWHRGLKSTFVHPWIEWLGITSPERAFRVARNKMIFMRKHSPLPNKLIFFFVLFPVYALIHSIIIVLARRFDILLQYWSGVISGLIYAATYPLNKAILQIYQNLDKKLEGFKMLLLSLTDPITWILRSDIKSVLDLGCGQGKPMEFIKYRIKIKKSVGVDLFEPYIQEAKQKKIHSEYLLTDIRKVSFKPKSFDLVMASHVLEHLPEKEAWKVLENMEKMAKKQVIVVTPIGEHYHQLEDGNIWQLHVSAFTPRDFIARGYQVKKYGWKWLLGDHGIVHTIKNDLIRKLLYTFNILATPIYYYFQRSCDYIFVAYKNFDAKK